MISVLSDILPIIIYVLLIIILIVGIILGIKGIKTIDKLNDTLDDLNDKLDSVNGIFQIFDFVQDKASSLFDHVAEIGTGILKRIFDKKIKRRDDYDDDNLDDLFDEEDE